MDRSGADAYHVELRFANPLNEAQISPIRGDAQLDTVALRGLQLRPQEYGQALAAMLFSDPHVRGLYHDAMVSSRSLNLPVRVRLLVGPNAPELQAVRWELLTDPDRGDYLFTSERMLFSRFISSQDWRTVRLPAKTELRTLIAISAPSNVADYGLAEVDVAGECDRAFKYLRGADLAAAIAGRDRPLTFDELLDRMRVGVDILYLVCHGGVTERGPHLYLQGDDGRVAVVKGRDFAQRVNDLLHPPALAVLVSCESGGKESPSGDPDAEAFGSLAPMLAAAGVPAIVAMRGKISVETAKQIMLVFFRELVLDGQVDRAVAVARSVAVVRGRPDFWMSALYLRLRNGCIWGDARGADAAREIRVKATTPPGAIPAAELGVIEKSLARELGPIARHVLRNASRIAANTGELCRAVALEIGDEAARRRFLESCEMGLKAYVPAHKGLDPAVLERARKHLSAFIGPLAKTIVDRAGTRVTSIDELYTALAEEIGSAGDRKKFTATRPD